MPLPNPLDVCLERLQTSHFPHSHPHNIHSASPLLKVAAPRHPSHPRHAHPHCSSSLGSSSSLHAVSTTCPLPCRITLTERHNVDNKHPVLQWHILEVDSLHPRPQQEVVRHARHIGLLQLLLGVRALEIRHRRQEKAHVDGCEDELVAGHSRNNGAVRRGHVNAALEEAVPSRGGGAKDGWRIVRAWREGGRRRIGGDAPPP
jgi:hypothetical protein